jgi:hypothetical protein
MKSIILILVGLAIILPTQEALMLNPAFHFFFRAPPHAFIHATPMAGTRLFWKRSAEQPKTQEIIKCTFEKEKLKCERGQETVECDAVLINESIRNVSFDSFGISAEWKADAKSIEKISLHPKRVQSSTWKHPKVKDPKTQIVYDFSLFSSDKSTDSGLRVKTEECWRRLVEFIARSTSTETIKVGRMHEARIVGVISLQSRI